MTMQLRKALRKAAKLRISFSATAGSGKTYSALKCAYGLTGDWNKVALIDTENGSGDLYAHLGPYNVLTLTSFTPEKYIEAIIACEQAGMEVIIIDSITHEWDTLLAIQSAMPGNSYTNWAKVTPRHDAFKNKILQSPCHVFTTVRRKTEYEINKDSSGKTTIDKLGTKEQTREGWDYENTIVFEIDAATHTAKATKDRTEIFLKEDNFLIDEETGKRLRQWADNGVSDTEILLQAGLVEVNNVSNLNGLSGVWTKFSELQGNDTFKEAVKAKRDLFSPVKQ